MALGDPILKASAAGLLSAGLFFGSVAVAQTKPGTIPDAQIEANVLKALAGAPELADQSITSTTVYGVVTLNGTVRDEPSRDLAEHLVANTAGVQKVVDRMIVSASGAPASNDSQQGASNPNLQSDGTVAPSQGQNQAAPASPAPSGAPAAPSAPSAPATPGAPAAPPAPNPQSGQYPQQPYPPQAGQYPQQPYPPQAGQYPQPYPQGGQYPQQPYPQAGQYPPAYPPQGGPYPQQPYPQAGQYPPAYPPQSGQYPQPYPPQYVQPYVPQKGGDAVVVPNGSALRVRINQGMSSKSAVQGATFDGMVLNDVYVGNQIAIPRGATIQGVVADAHPAGQLSGKGELKLQLTGISFGGQSYPIATDFWWHQGPDKTGATVGNTVGLAGLGAVIGAVAGGGAGAAVGAGVGAVAGLGVSSASRQGEASLPSEAIVTFHLTQPADVTTVSQAELNRLGAGTQRPQVMYRNVPPPPYGYPYPAPVYYYPR